MCDLSLVAVFPHERFEECISTRLAEPEPDEPAPRSTRYDRPVCAWFHAFVFRLGEGRISALGWGKGIESERELADQLLLRESLAGCVRFW